MKIHPAISCPTCHGPLTPTQLHCQPCNLTITGTFSSNEFASLAEDDLHFLRIFILCEGRIRDMESALGVSYPTIKARLTQLKSTLTAHRPTPPASTQTPPSNDSPTANILHSLQSGNLTYEQAMQQLKEISLRKDPS